MTTVFYRWDNIAARTLLCPWLLPSLPLDHFERRFVVDLQAQIFKSDGQMPTVCPP
jgi:hypothetical protein